MSDRRNVGLDGGFRTSRVQQGGDAVNITQDDRGDIKEVRSEPHHFQVRQELGEELAVKQALFAQIAQNRVAEITEDRNNLYAIATA